MATGSRNEFNTRLKVGNLILLTVILSKLLETSVQTECKTLQLGNKRALTDRKWVKWSIKLG